MNTTSENNVNCVGSQYIRSRINTATLFKPANTRQCCSHRKMSIKMLGNLTYFRLKPRACSIGCASAWYPDGRVFDPHVRQNILSLRFGHEKKSTTILSISLFQEGQLSVNGERMGTQYWYTGSIPVCLA